jgi:hypothetical protein
MRGRKGWREETRGREERQSSDWRDVKCEDGWWKLIGDVFILKESRAGKLRRGKNGRNIRARIGEEMGRMLQACFCLFTHSTANG